MADKYELTDNDLKPLIDLIKTLQLRGETEEDRFQEYITELFRNANRDYQFLRKLVFDNIDQLYQYIQKSAETKNTIGLLLFAELNEKGIKIEKNLLKAIEIYKEISETGNPHALGKYGSFIFQGFVDGIDQKEGWDLINQAASMGDEFAMLFMAEEQVNPFSAYFNPEEGFQRYKFSADIGFGESKIRFCDAILKNKFGEINNILFEEYLIKACKDGYGWQKIRYAKELISGENIKKNLSEAKKHFRDGAETGSSEDRREYAQACFDGVFGTIDEEDGKKFFQMAESDEIKNPSLEDIQELIRKLNQNQ